MIRSSTHVVMCVRQPNNEILTHRAEINSLSERYRILRLPFLRGIIALIETLYLGVKGIYFSANAVLEEEEKLTPKELAVVVVLATALLSVFFVVPFLSGHRPEPGEVLLVVLPVHRAELLDHAPRLLG